MYKYLLFTLLLFSPLSIQATSFDCNKASTVNEKIICSSPNLSNLDDLLSTSYNKTKENASNLNELKKEQVGFIKQTRLCDNEDCLRILYCNRIADLINKATTNEGLLTGENHLKATFQAECFKKTRETASVEAQQETIPYRDKIFAQAKTAYDIGDYDRVIQLAKPLAEKGDAEAQLSLGIVYERGKQDYAEGLKWYRLSALQGNPTAQLMIGSMYLKEKDIVTRENGVLWIKKAADQGLEPAILLLKQLTEDANKDKANAILKQDEVRKTEIDQLPVMIPADQELEENAETFFNRANLFSQLKQFEKAVESYDRAIVIRPNFAEAYFNRANALEGLKQLDKAQLSYNHAIALKPDLAEVHSDLNPQKQTKPEQFRFKPSLQSDLPKDIQTSQNQSNPWLLRAVLILLLIFLYRYFRKL